VTDENRRRNIGDELKRADESMRAAEALLGLGLHADSVSRSYYAVLHLVRALLLSLGLEARSHSGIVHLFHAELVRPGLFPPTHNRALAALQRSREFADYDAAVTFSQADAEASLADARAFAEDTLKALRSTGHAPD
jgi:uncharacterized protein (UPF0332 family)